MYHLRLHKPRDTAAETYADVRCSLIEIERRPDAFPKLQTVTIEYYTPTTRIVDMIGPLHGLWDEVDELRCVSVGRHMFPVPERNFEIRFENPRTIAPWETTMASRGNLKISVEEYMQVIFRRRWHAHEHEQGLNTIISAIPKFHTLAECHRVVADLSIKAVCALAHEVDYLSSLDHGRRARDGLTEVSEKVLAEHAPYRAENNWSQPGQDEDLPHAFNEDFDRSRRRPLLLNITLESSSEDLEAVTELLDCNLAVELMPTGLLRMVIDKMENQEKLIEERGFWWYAKPRHMKYDFGGSRVWPCTETDLRRFEE